MDKVEEESFNYLYYSIPFRNWSVLAAFALLLAMTGEVAAYDQDKYESCYKQKCEDLEEAAANAGAGSREGTAHGIAIIACDIGCKNKAKEKPKCGALNQRPCKVWERVPSCDKGLKEKLFANRCVPR